MDTTSAPTIPPDVREPGVDWDLLRRLARRPQIRTGVEAKDGVYDAKPNKSAKWLHCRACRVKYPGGAVCGYCRARIADLRREAAGQVPAGGSR